MKFAIFAIVFMYVGRRIGWLVSRKFLYEHPLPLAIMECMNWGAATAWAIRLLIDAEKPGTSLRWILGYCLGAYVACPNFGLYVESSISPHERGRHAMVTVLPVVCYLWVTFVLAAASA
jgi:hypothetical protein